MKRLAVFLIIALAAVSVMNAENGENPVSAYYENTRIALFDAYSFGMGGASIGSGNAPANFLNNSGYAFSFGVDGFAGTGMYFNYDGCDSYLAQNIYGGLTFPVKNWFVINISGVRTEFLFPKNDGTLDESELADNYIDTAFVSVNRFVEVNGISLGFGIAGKYLMPNIGEDYQYPSEDVYNESAFGADLSFLAKFHLGMKGSVNVGVSFIDIVKPMDVATGMNFGTAVEYKHQLAGDAKMTVAVDYLMNHSESGALRAGIEEWFADETVALRAGYMQNTFYTDGGGLLGSEPSDAIYDTNGQITAGLGVKFSGFQFNAGYALKSDYTGDSMTFGMAYMGGVKKKMTYKITPKVELSAADDWFSPNGDGKKDQIRIRIDSKDAEIIKKWNLNIADENGKDVAAFKGKKGLPMFVTWDGTEKGKKTVADGKYYASISVKDKYGNKGDSGRLPLMVRTKAPQVALRVQPELLVPGKGISMTVTTGEYVDVKKTVIYIKKGVDTVHMIEFSGIKDVYEWTGVYNDGSYPAEGETLQLFAEVTDSGDNTGKSMLAEISVGAAQVIEAVKPVISEEYPPIPALFVAARIVFDENKSGITESDKAELARVIELMNNRPGATVRIEGHTDNQGTAADNMTLSKNRAEKVKEYMVSKGISPERITAKGFGEDMPIDSNATAKGRKNNRRVDVILING